MLPLVTLRTQLVAKSNSRSPVVAAVNDVPGASLGTSSIQ
jgi:hypothetical protein